MKVINRTREAYEGQFFVQDTSAIPRESDSYWEKKRDTFKSHKDVGKIVAFKDEPWSSAYEVIGSDGDIYEIKKIGSPSGQIGVIRAHWEDIGFADDVVDRYTDNFSLDNGEFESTKPYLSNAIIHILKQHYKNVVKDLTKKPNIFRFSDKIINESLCTKMKFKLLETYLREDDAHTVGDKHDPRTCPRCAKQLGIELKQPNNNQEDKTPTQKVAKKEPTKKIVAKKAVAKETNESFEYDLEPGKEYYFMHHNNLTKGKFKYKTKAWQVFEREDGKEVSISPWSNVATTPEEIIGVEQVVDRMEKDTKVPNVLHLPNRFVK